jgi:predicted short-subunit dehydrogenase-like oxidoreductase (DUF2520 family)
MAARRTARDDGAAQHLRSRAARRVRRRPDTPILTPDELARIAELAKTNFGVEEEKMSYKGTMTYRRREAPAAACV